MLAGGDRMSTVVASHFGREPRLGLSSSACYLLNASLATAITKTTTSVVEIGQMLVVSQNLLMTVPLGGLMLEESFTLLSFVRAKTKVVLWI